MEVPVDLYKRLSEKDLRLLPELAQPPKGDRVVLPKQLQVPMDSGYLAAQYLLKIEQSGVLDETGVAMDSEGLSQIQSTQNAQAKLKNWTKILTELMRYEVDVEDEDKGLLAKGDSDTILSVMLRIYQFELEMSLAKETQGRSQTQDERISKRGESQDAESPSRLSVFKEVKPEQPISILQLKADRPLNQTQTTLEFVIVSLCQALGLTTNQAAALLTDHNYYLMQACIKGVKRDYEPILKWYSILYQESKHLIDLAVESLPTPNEDPLNDSQIMEEDTQPLFVMLSALKSGFFSDYFAVSSAAYKLFSKISSELNAYGYQKVFSKWFLQQPEADNGKLGGGLEATLTMLRKHSQIVENVALLLISAFQGYFELLIPEIKRFCPTPISYYTLINDLMPSLLLHHREEVILKVIVDTSLLQELVKQAESNRPADTELKSACLALIGEIWSLEPSLITEDPNTTTGGSTILDSCLRVMKNTCKFSTRCLKLSTMALAFRLLDQFALGRDPQAPMLYKLLTFALVENIEDEEIRDYILTSFSQVFAVHKTIPVSILAEPLLRMIQMSDKRLELNVHDYAFFNMLAKHPKLAATPQGLLMMDQFAKVILNNPLWGSSAEAPFVVLAERFGNLEPTIQDFLLKFSTLAITQILSLHKQTSSKAGKQGSPKGSPKSTQSRSVKLLKTSQSNKSGLSAGAKLKEQDIARRIKLASIVRVVEKILTLRLSPIGEDVLDLNDQLRELVLSTSRKYKQMHGTQSRALLHLLEFWHSFEAQQVLDEYNRHHDGLEKVEENTVRGIMHVSHIKEDAQRLIVTDEEGHYQGLPDSEYQKLIMPTDETRNSELSYGMRQQINQSRSSHRSLRQDSHQGSRQLVPYQPEKTKPPLSKRVNIIAANHIEAIRNKRDEKAVKQQLDEERKKQMLENQVKKAKEELAKRRYKLGVVKGPQVENQLAIYQPPEEEEVVPKRNSLAPARHPQAEGLKLVDLDNEEEERDRDGVKIILAKYSKVFKYLFNKYAHSCGQHQRVVEFEQIVEKIISVAEVCKMLKDYDILASLASSNMLTQVVKTEDGESSYIRISKEQVQALVRLINNKNQRKQDTTTLTYQAFLELMPQVAFLIYQQTLPHLSMPEMLMRLLQHNERVTKAKGLSAILYEDPDVTTIGDQEVLKELNKRLKDQPDFILPEGYYKVQEKEQVFSYKLPWYISQGIGEAKTVALEVLDQIMSEKMGFHILEALVSYESRFKVKPRIKHTSGMAKSQESQNPAVSMMRQIEKRSFGAARDSSAPKGGPVNQSPGGKVVLAPIGNLENQKPIVQPDPFVKPKLSAGLKLEVIAFQKDKSGVEKTLIQDTAEVLEEILLAVESGHKGNLPPRERLDKEVKNKASQDKESKAKQDKLLEKQKEDLRKKRHAKLMEEIEKKKQEAIKQEEEGKAKKEEEEKQRKLKEKRDKTQVRQRLDAKRQQIEESKKKKEEEKQAKLKEEEDKKLAELQARQKEQKLFFKKQKAQLEQDFQRRIQEKEEAERIKKEMEELKRVQQENVKAKMVNFMRQNKDQQRNEQGEWDEIQLFYDSDEVQGLFSRYEKSLGLLFKHYAVLDKKDMANHSMMRINLNEFTKFGFQKYMVPRVVSLEDMTLIFRALVRERSSIMTQEEKDFLGIGVNSLGLEDFKKALIRIAILGQARLPEGEVLETKLLEWLSDPSAKVPIVASRAPKNVRVRGRSVLNSAGSQRLQRQQSNQAIEAEGDTKRPSVPPKKTREQKMIEELAKAKERQEKLGNVKIEDKKLNKSFDVSLINAATMQMMITYLGLKLNQNLETQQAAGGEQELPQEDGEDKNNYGGNDDEQQASHTNDMQGDYDDGAAYHENIIGPNGENEDWRMDDA